MWTDEQLDRAQYTANHDYESKQALNVGTIEISGANGGTFLVTPVPPFGGLTGENTVQGVSAGVHVPMKQWIAAYTPKGLPVPERASSDQYVIHQYGNGSL